MFPNRKRCGCVFLETSSFMHVDETGRFDIPNLAAQTTPHSSTTTHGKREADSIFRVVTVEKKTRFCCWEIFEVEKKV